MASKLAFDLDDLKKLKKETEELDKQLTEQKNSLKQGLDQLRTDWQTTAGYYFFENIDSDWETNIDKFLKTLRIFEEIIADAINQFQEVVDKANAIGMDLG